MYEVGDSRRVYSNPDLRVLSVIDGARAQLRRAQGEMDDVCAQAGRLAETTDWQSRSADAYRAAVGAWNSRLTVLAVRLVLLDDDLIRARFRAERQLEAAMP